MYQRNVNVSQFDQGKAELFSSTIVAKAVLSNPKGGVFVAAVFEKSTRHEFIWVYTAKSARAPRKSWKVFGYFGRDQAGYTDFGSFVAYFATMRGAQIKSIRLLRVKALKAMQTARLRESLHAAQVVQDPAKISTKLVEQKYARGRMGRSAIFHNWKAS